MMIPLYQNIRKRRMALGLSQQELADKLGYKSRSAINKIELGINDLTQSKIIAFAKALDTTPGELMGWGESTAEDKNTLVQDGDNDFTAKEKAVIKAYRAKPEMQTAVNTLLGIEQPEDTNSETGEERPVRTIRVAAYKGGVTEHHFTATDEEIKQAIEENDENSEFVFEYENQDI